MRKLFFSSGALAGNPFPIDRKSLATGKKRIRRIIIFADAALVSFKVDVT